jgi:hypothetical protein
MKGDFPHQPRHTRGIVVQSFLGILCSTCPDESATHNSNSQMMCFLHSSLKGADFKTDQLVPSCQCRGKFQILSRTDPEYKLL